MLTRAAPHIQPLVRDTAMPEVVYRGAVHVPSCDLWLDPPMSCAFAFVSHAHSDHTGRHRETVLSAATSRLMRARIGPSPHEHVLEFGETRELRGARFTLLPAGHVHGSAQLHLEDEAGSLLYTGDFKLRAGRASEPVEWRGADTLIMETTYGKPEFVFPPSGEVLDAVVKFCREALEDDEVPVLLGYSLGKAQEILCAVHEAGLQPMLHGSVAKMTRIYRELIPGFPAFADYEASAVRGHVLICPPSVRGSAMLRRIGRCRVAMLTGWALVPGAIHRYQCDAVFPLSDHAGYDDLLEYVRLVAPRRVLTLHGFAAEFARDLRARGVEAWSLVSPDQLELPGLSAATSRPQKAPLAAAPADDSPFGRFCAVADSVASATGRRAKTTILAGYFGTLDEDDLRRAATWLGGAAFASSEAHRLQTGWAILRRAVASVAGVPFEEARAVSRRLNDAGLATAELLAARKPSGSHDLAGVEDAFRRLGEARGPLAKQALIEDLFRRLGAREAAYVVRILTGDLRIGLKEGLIEEAVGSAFGCAGDELREAAMLLGDAGALAVAARQGRLGDVSLRVFHPLKCMLAGSEPDAAGVWARLAAEHGCVYAEDKLDGIRVQLHTDGVRCELYSRDLRCITRQFPEIAAAGAQLGCPMVLDGEILASADGRPGRFTDLQRRLNRREPDLFLTADVPVEFVVFDVLRCGGATLVRRPWRERRDMLESLGLAPPLTPARLTVASSAAAVDEAFLAARARGHEGLVAKDPSSPYSPGRRGLAWIKLKKELATLDVVVTAVEYGHGRRREVLSDYTFAVRDESGGALLVIGKAYTGLTDREIAELTPWFLARVRSVRGRTHQVRPELVIEVAFDSIRPSPRHPSGLALRFPRIKRIRRDKTPDEIDTLETARRLAAG
jgi:DNA ligase-1